ncbi:flavodoxin domain-containing protein [Mangrovibacterium lignilyticum]|uniref:flavodoxin domain-containing protein n=1 Tax=Mangrovibacterium lignilyticum TaxID=2668052 RepID=UPI0013D7D910|nr:flavodoxin domain-containing protein [Mangrovibacterium lignilyticum]
MGTVIIYMSTHGCTAQVVQQIANRLSGDISIVNLKQKPTVDVNMYERVIIGGSIHSGKIQKGIAKFCESNLKSLIQKEVGLFICCMYEGDKARAQLEGAFPELLHQYAKTEAIMGGALNFKKMNLVERFVVKKISGQNKNTEKIDKQAISKFSREMEKTVPDFLLFH